MNTDMNHQELETEAIREFLRANGRLDLPAIPNSFSEISTIQDIAFSSIKIVPQCINQLSGLKTLYLQWCKLNYIPDALFDLKKLEVLNLSVNNLQLLPKLIVQLTSLTHLHLSDNNLKSLPHEIYKLKNLKKLYLYNNKLGFISEKIGDLINLTHLSIDKNNLIEIPKSIGNLINLNDNSGLSIFDNPLQSLPNSIRKIKHTLSYNSIGECKSLLEDVEYRVYKRFQCRLVILSAKPGPPLNANNNIIIYDEEAIEKHYNQAKYQVLQNPLLQKRISDYIDWTYNDQRNLNMKMITSINNSNGNSNRNDSLLNTVFNFFNINIDTSHHKS